MATTTKAFAIRISCSNRFGFEKYKNSQKHHFAAAAAAKHVRNDEQPLIDEILLFYIWAALWHILSLAQQTTATRFVCLSHKSTAKQQKEKQWEERRKYCRSNQHSVWQFQRVTIYLYKCTYAVLVVDDGINASLASLLLSGDIRNANFIPFLFALLGNRQINQTIEYAIECQMPVLSVHHSRERFVPMHTFFHIHIKCCVFAHISYVDRNEKWFKGSHCATHRMREPHIFFSDFYWWPIAIKSSLVKISPHIISIFFLFRLTLYIRH